MAINFHRIQREKNQSSTYVHPHMRRISVLKAQQKKLTNLSPIIYLKVHIYIVIIDKD